MGHNRGGDKRKARLRRRRRELNRLARKAEQGTESAGNGITQKARDPAEGTAQPIQDADR